MKNVVFLGALLFLASCASLSEKECKTGNWAEVGERDGQRGYADSRLLDHSKACGEYAISPDKVQYKKGYKVGNQKYCDSKGLEFGRAGKENQSPRVCSGNSGYKKSFKVGFNEFCQAKGVEAGQSAKKDIAPKACRSKREFAKGFSEGLKVYCTFENGEEHGKKAQDHRARYCPRSLRSTFLKGLALGLESYCRRENGFRIAQSGAKHRGEKCPSSMRRDFSAAYDKGLEYRSLDQKIAEINKKVSALEGKINDPNSSPDLRAHLSGEVASKKAEMKSLEVRKIKIEGFVGI